MPTLRPRQTRPPWLLALPTTAALLLSLTGCSDTTEIPQAEPTPSATPLFASEEEALEAATAVYEEYLAASNQVLEEGGSNPDLVAPYLSPEIFAEEAAGFQTLLSEGQSFTGGTRAIDFEFQQSSAPDPMEAEVQFYACVTNEGTVRLDRELEPTPEQPPTFVGTFEVIVQFFADSTSRIQLKEFWAEGNQCSVN